MPRKPRCQLCDVSLYQMGRGTETHLADMTRIDEVMDYTYAICGTLAGQGGHWIQICTAHVTCDECIELYKTKEGYEKANFGLDTPLPEHDPIRLKRK